MTRTIATAGIFLGIIIGAAAPAYARDCTVFYGNDSDSQSRCEAFASAHNGRCLFGNGSWVVAYSAEPCVPTPQ
jgi:hypothetical protein